MNFGKVWRITRQELKMTAANKAFVITTILGPIFILAVAVLPSLLATRSGGVQEGTAVAVVGAAPELFASLRDAAAESGITLVRGQDVLRLRNQVESGDLQGFLVVPEDWMQAANYNYYSKTGTDITVSSVLESLVGRFVVEARIRGAGLDPAVVSALTQRPSVELQKVAPAGESNGGGAGSGGGGGGFVAIYVTAMAFVMMIYMTVLLYGQMIGRSVLTEKTSKTVEIMLSSTRPIELLFGKIFGKGLAGLIQYAFWISVALLLVRVVGPAFNLQVPASLTIGNLLLLAMFFILAFFLYSSAYAALGAGAEDEQHLSQLAMPLLLFLIVPLVMISAIVMNPGSTLAVVLSYVPFTAPIIMLLRVLLTAPPVWEVALSVAIMIVSIFGMIWVSSRIFRVGILMTGKRFDLKQILRWINA